MRTNLLEFLFGENAVCETKGHDLGEQIVRLFEEADEAEGVEMVANKKPLADALKALGIDEPVETGAHWCEIHCDDDAKYHDYTRKLVDPDAMTKLAEMGWVLVKCGDNGMANEKPDYRLGFIEIECNYTGAQDKPGKADNLEKMRKDAQKDASTEFKRKNSKDPAKGNTVEIDDPKMGDRQTGIGKAADGKDPEGTPKGATKKVKESKTIKALADSLLEDSNRPEDETSKWFQAVRRFISTLPLFKDNGNAGDYASAGSPMDPKDELEMIIIPALRYSGPQAQGYLKQAQEMHKRLTGMSEATMASGVPAFPSGGNPMSILSPRNRALPRRKSKTPVKAHGVSPANS